jgi:hypothetical protein
MPLFEIVLRHPEGYEEVRFTDRSVAVGDTLVIANRRWDVVLERKAGDIRATAQFLCELTREQRGRTIAAQSQDEAMKRRLQALQASPPGSDNSER